MTINKIAEFFLKNPFVYWSYQGLVGGHKARKHFVKNDVRPRPNIKLLDMGCGPGNMIEYLPNLDYTGFDADKKYIDAAVKKYEEKGLFIHSDIESFEITEPNSFDIAMASGLLHHLDDNNAKRFFEIAKTALKPNGRLITVDGCYIKGQSRIAKFLLDQDRGEYIRTQSAYEALAETSFDKVNISIKHSYFNVPYTLIVMECIA
ncbi:methyltransferase domain-containing protein [Winogradskyella sp. 3972H.M.0a.05]|uniref:class I SAM-dependent methyltransferase n=1 Tax=Winogradskyella sp. 3972H.M.0a.05 TaxID=2950277 RepID=UPI003393DBE0